MEATRLLTVLNMSTHDVLLPQACQIHPSDPGEVGTNVQLLPEEPNQMLD